MFEDLEEEEVLEHPKKILIVDDEPLVLDTLTMMLETEGYQVIRAYNGEEGLRKLWGGQGLPDLILADIMMPVMDGWEFCKKVKDNPHTKKIPFIFLTAKKELVDRIKGYELGAQRYLTKPYEKREVLATVNTRLKEAEKTKEIFSKKGKRFKGQLSSVSLYSLIECFFVGGWSGKIVLCRGEELGVLTFKNAEIEGAISGELRGKDALKFLLSWTEGEFAVERD